MSETPKTLSLKRPPAYGVFRWWPENGDSWIFPADVELVHRLIPGKRVFRRVDTDDNWLQLEYGSIRFRIRSTIWLEVPYEGFDIGDAVEVKSRMGVTEPFVGKIRDMFWNHKKQLIEYFLDRVESNKVRAYSADDLIVLDPLKRGREPDEQRRQLQPNSYYVRQPPEA